MAASSAPAPGVAITTPPAEPTTPPPARSDAAAGADAAAGHRDSAARVRDTDARAGHAAAAERVRGEPDLKDIHFDFDKYDIRPDAAQILDANATWLKANAQPRADRGTLRRARHRGVQPRPRRAPGQVRP